jgi:hypothetical protein
MRRHYYMTRVYTEREEWQGSLPLGVLLELAEELEEFLPDKEDSECKATLDDRTQLRDAKTVDVFRAELDAENEIEVVEASIGIGSEKVAFTWLHWKRDDSISLESKGRVEDKVRGVHGAMHSRILKRFLIAEQVAAKSKGTVVGGRGGDVHIAGDVVGPVSGGNVAASNDGPAVASNDGPVAASNDGPAVASSESSANSRAKQPDPWWINPWVIALVTTFVTALVVGLILSH